MMTPANATATNERGEARERPLPPLVTTALDEKRLRPWYQSVYQTERIRPS